jgi:hypothetical protein
VKRKTSSNLKSTTRQKRSLQKQLKPISPPFAASYCKTKQNPKVPATICVPSHLLTLSPVCLGNHEQNRFLTSQIDSSSDGIVAGPSQPVDIAASQPANTNIEESHLSNSDKINKTDCSC